VQHAVVLFSENPHITVSAKIRHFSNRNFTAQCFKFAGFQARAAKSATIFNPPGFLIFKFKGLVRAGTGTFPAPVAFVDFDTDSHIILQGGCSSPEKLLSGGMLLKWEDLRDTEYLGLPWA
jgi:hypothetical protein